MDAQWLIFEAILLQDDVFYYFHSKLGTHYNPTQARPPTAKNQIFELLLSIITCDKMMEKDHPAKITFIQGNSCCENYSNQVQIEFGI